MIPFARVLNYGNKTEAPFIKDISFGLSSSFCYMILLSSGDMYTGGYNNSGQLGIGNKTDQFRKLFKITSDVRLVSCSPYSSIYISNDNKVYLSGDRGMLNSAGSLAGWSTFTDISSYFSTIDISKIVKIGCEYNTAVLMENGDLYGIGLNRYGEFGLGSTGYKSLTLIATNVKDFGCTAQTLVYQKNDGTVWGAGRNSYYGLKSSTEGGVLNQNITTFTRMFSTIQDPILKIRTGISVTSAYTETHMHSLGDNYRGQFGDGNMGSTTNTAGLMISVQLPVPLLKDNPYIPTVYPSTNVNVYIGNDMKMYATGYNSNSSLGVGYSTPDVVGFFTECPGVSVGAGDIVRYGMYNSYIGRAMNNIFGCGNNSNGTCLTTDVFTASYSNLTKLPWK